MGAQLLYHSIHSVQGFTQPGKAFAIMIDNEEGVTAPFKDPSGTRSVGTATPAATPEPGREGDR